MGQNPNFRGGQNRTSRWGQNQVSRGGQNGSRGGQIQKFFGATRRRKTALRAEDFAPPLRKHPGYAPVYNDFLQGILTVAARHRYS